MMEKGGGDKTGEGGGCKMGVVVDGAGEGV